ncbi:MAG: efflux RND transporter permease subunit, partial [Candidatus Electrothrix sp. AUS1_2]|nr:efflux RND transporter permease subunit [Candidatus Electrothrix sp. AUS1_2]
MADTVRKAAVDIPAGGIKTQGGEILLRTSERRETALEFSNLRVISQKDGTELPLSSIATIRDDFAETDREAWYNGKRAVFLYIYRTGNQTPIEISEAVRQYI